MTFTTRRFSVETDCVRVAVALGAADDEGVGAARVALGLAGGLEEDLDGDADGSGRESPACRVRTGVAAVLDGERSGRGLAVSRAGGVRRGAGLRPSATEEAVGVPTVGGPVGAPGGSVESPVRPRAALRGSTLASSKTSLRSTSRTPNQATEIARTVAPHHTAMNPSVCRMS
ncbi:hypothetical protein [Streptosporangium sp. NPDC002721]|uniref:hypothetical protein n=1 Tax=Streptosporangium sp. NPDC002721 TaxID=3366188 RepID=UPI003684C006